MTGLTRSLAEFVAGLDPDALPPEAVATVRRGVADCIGVMFAGRDEPVVAIARDSITCGDRARMAEGPAPAASRALVPVLGGPQVARVPDAAFVDVTAAHALDYDDVAIDGHPSVVLAPVVIAQGRAREASGPRTIAAYVAGYETWAELAGRDADKHHGKGWHPTAVFGAVAAAAAAAYLARLDVERTAHALGIAASMSAGVTANFGTMTKPLQVGLAARNGVLAAQLAEHGATAAADALEHPRGLLAALSPHGRARLEGPARAGAPWQIVRQGLNIKRYPVCYGAHRAIDASLSLRERLAGRYDAIDRIVVEIGRHQADMLRNADPRTVLDAKFSAQFAVATALVRGHVGLRELDEATLADPQVQRLMERVQVERLDAHDAHDPLFAPFDRVTVVLRGGERLASEPIARALGHADRPIDEPALRTKFMDCAQRTLGAPHAQRWWEAIARLERDGPAALPTGA